MLALFFDIVQMGALVTYMAIEKWKQNQYENILLCSN